MTRFHFLRSLSWAPTVSLSWMWGLGFFYSMHIVWVQGWTGFWVFAIANACGLALFGWVLNSPRRDPETLFGKLGPRFVFLFLLCQVGAVGITLFSLSAYLWPVLFPDADAAIILALSALIVAIACATGHAIPLKKLRFVHIGYLGLGVVAIALTWLFMPTGAGSRAETELTSTFSVWTFLIPTLVGFLLGPWGDLQQWQRAVEIKRNGSSPAIAYAGGGFIFLALLLMNAVLSRSAGVNVLIGADGAIGAQSSVAASLATGEFGIGVAAFALWAAIAAVSTIDSFYCSTRWYLSSLLSKSLHPALAFLPTAAAASPFWILGAAALAASTMSAWGLSQTAYMMPYATVFAGVTTCLVAECIGRSTNFDSVTCYLTGLVAGIVFFIGYTEGMPSLIPLSTALALIGAFPVFRSFPADTSKVPAGQSSLAKAESEIFGGPGRTAVLPVTEESAGQPAPDRAVERIATASHGFDGQWFVMRVTPTYDDTNSVGNVYFANYFRWVGKARELFFNACMPKFDLETTRYYVLTRSFQHDFRREIAEFEPATIRIRIVGHNRKFVTLGHEIVSETHGLLGRGEQSLMFVDRESFKPLDIPVDIVRGFLPFWPSNKAAEEDAYATGQSTRKVG